MLDLDFWRANCVSCIGFLGMAPLQTFVDALYGLVYDAACEPRKDAIGQLLTMQPVYSNERQPRLACLAGGWVGPGDIWMHLPHGRLLWLAVTGALTPLPTRGIGFASVDRFEAPGPVHKFAIGHGGGDGDLAIATPHRFQIASTKNVFEFEPPIEGANRLRIGGDAPFFAIGMCYLDIDLDIDAEPSDGIH